MYDISIIYIYIHIHIHIYIHIYVYTYIPWTSLNQCHLFFFGPEPRSSRISSLRFTSCARFSTCEICVRTVSSWAGWADGLGMRNVKFEWTYAIMNVMYVMYAIDIMYAIYIYYVSINLSIYLSIYLSINRYIVQFTRYYTMSMYRSEPNLLTQAESPGRESSIGPMWI